MSERPPLFARLARLVNPTAIDDYAPPLRQLDDGLWLTDRKLRMPPGLVLPTNMTVLRLPAGGVLVHAPVRLDATLSEQLDALGGVRAVVAPNSFHHLFAAQYLDAFPQARFFPVPTLRERIDGLPEGEALGAEPPPLWAGLLDQMLFGPRRGICEAVFLHRPSATLILTDLAFNMRRFDGPLSAAGWRLLGVPARFGPSRTARITFLADRAAARADLERILRWHFQRIIVAHGDVLEHDAQGEFRRAYALGQMLNVEC